MLELESTSSVNYSKFLTERKENKPNKDKIPRERRSKIINFILDAHHKLEDKGLSKDSIFTTIGLFDRLLELKKINLEHLYEIAAASFLIVMKLQEKICPTIDIL